ARYNSWMNDKLYATAARLDDAARKADRGAFFGSIHGTLNHLLVGDRVWMARFTGMPSGVSRLDEELYGNFDELAAERQRLDAVIVDWASGLSADDLGREFEYTSLTGSVRRRSPMWLVVAHMVNHQTHHRPALPSRRYRDPRLTGASRRPAARPGAARRPASGSAAPFVQQSPREGGGHAEIRPAELGNDGRIDRHHLPLHVQHGAAAAA